MVLDVCAVVAKTNEFKKINDSMKLLEKDVRLLKKKNERQLAILNKRKSTILNKVKAFKKKIEQLLDKLEKTTMQEMEKSCATGVEQINNESQFYDDILRDFGLAREAFTSGKPGPEGEMCVFVGMKRAQEKLQAGVRVVDVKKVSAVSEPVTFTADDRIVQWLASLQTLGTFSTLDVVYTAELVDTYNMHSQSDLRENDMFGCTFLPDGRLAIADWDNKCLKLTDSSFKNINSIVVNGNPNDVGVVNPTEVVVSFPMQKLVQFVEIEPKLALKHVIRVNENCRGVAYHSGLLYVTCGGFKEERDGKIKVYSYMGDLTRTIETNTFNQRFFHCPISVCLSSDGKLIYVADGQRGIVTLTQTNDVVSVVSDRDSQWPCGVCVDKNDNVISCCGQSNNIIQVARLIKIATVIPKGRGVKRPHCLCFDQRTSRLAVTVSRSRHVFVFQLKAPSISDVAEGKMVPHTVRYEGKGQAENTEDTTKRTDPSAENQANAPPVNKESKWERQNTTEHMQTSGVKAKTDGSRTPRRVNQTTPSDVKIQLSVSQEPLGAIRERASMAGSTGRRRSASSARPVSSNRAGARQPGTSSNGDMTGAAQGKVTSAKSRDTAASVKQRRQSFSSVG